MNSIAVKQLYEDGICQDIGQVTKEDIKLFRKLKHNGFIRITRMAWLGCWGNKKTTYILTKEG